MKLHCPHCGVKGVADDAYRGKMVKCPKCLNTFVAGELVADLAGQEKPSAVIAEDSPVEKPAARGSEGESVSGPVAADEAVGDEALAAEEEDAPQEVGEEARVDDEAPGGIEGAAAETPATHDQLDSVSDQALSAEEVLEAPAAEEGQDGKEAVLDWEEIVAEVEARTAEGEEEEARTKEELPAGLFADTDEEEPARLVSDAAEGAVAGADEGESPGSPETASPATAAPAAMEGTPPESTRAEEGRDNHFIFEDRQAEPETVEVESVPYGISREQCWECGRKNRSGVPFIERNGRLYCPGCLPSEEAASEPPPVPGQRETAPSPAEDAETGAFPAGFAIGGILREAWEKTRGAKGPIWAGSALMYLTILFLAAAGAFLLPLAGYDPTAPDLGMAGDIFNFAYNALIDAVSVLFTAGLLYMGIRKVAGDPIDWKMVFTGYSQAGSIIVATILQSVMIVLGLLVLVLPGIYLAVGYSMTLPLIVDRKMSPWQAMETSRKAVHKVWWRVVGLYLVMVLLFIVSLVPLGLGLIWTWPMFVILAGVVYRSLFGLEK